MKENTERFRTSKKIRASEEFYTEENYFDRLPTELIISIFERIVDAKCLCVCYSVSKYFAAHVVQSRFVSVEIPYAFDQKFGGVPVWPQGVMNFLNKLCCVESATIQFSRNPNPRRSQQISKPLVWWKSDSFGFIFVFAESHGASVKATRKFTKEKRGDLSSSIENHLRDFKLRFRYIKELIVVLPNLKHICAVDSMKQGSIVMEEEGIAGMKKENPLDGRGELCIKMWITRKVKLPFSGCVMKNVTLILTREIGACDGLIAENLLEENEYREVAMTMMKKRTCSQISCSSVARGTIADVLYRPLSISMALLGFRWFF